MYVYVFIRNSVLSVDKLKESFMTELRFKRLSYFLHYFKVKKLIEENHENDTKMTGFGV